MAHDAASRNILATPTTSAEDEQSITSHYGNWSLKSMEMEAIDHIFTNHISSKEEVRVKEVKTPMVTDLTLRKLLTKPAMVKKVVDRIRYKQQR